MLPTSFRLLALAWRDCRKLFPAESSARLCGVCRRESLANDHRRYQRFDGAAGRMEVVVLLHQRLDDFEVEMSRALQLGSGQLVRG
jgi:hypothetical protein